MCVNITSHVCRKIQSSVMIILAKDFTEITIRTWRSWAANELVWTKNYRIFVPADQTHAAVDRSFMF